MCWNDIYFIGIFLLISKPVFAVNILYQQVLANNFNNKKQISFDVWAQIKKVKATIVVTFHLDAQHVQCISPGWGYLQNRTVASSCLYSRLGWVGFNVS